MTRLILGAPAPMFCAESHINPDFAFSSLGGNFVLLVFPPVDREGRAAVDAALEANRAVLGTDRVITFVVLRDRAEYEARTPGHGLRWFLDERGEIEALYGPAPPIWVLMDPMLRVLAFGSLTETDLVFRNIRNLPPPDRHAGVEITAPVLTVPRILEPALCRRLIDYYQERGGAPSGTMRQVGDRTVPVMSSFKSRRDASILDEDLKQQLRNRVRLRLMPEIERAFQFQVTRIERYIVACYDAGEGGYFRPHRDNTATATAHRKFAVSINLNAEQFEGGDLRFPEFGSRTYRPPTGGAVVFACGLLHEATPVTKGTRYATLPFLFDEAGEAIRQQNLHTLDTGQAQTAVG